jgi:uncharacterized protein
MTIAIICTGILAALLFVLGWNVSFMRGVTARAGGDQFSENPTSQMHIAIRAHGNAAEYVPALMVLFLLVGARSPAVVSIPLILGATAARLVHAVGLLTSKTLAAPTMPRLAGAAGTYLFGLGLAIAAVASL